jgi:hypothetical protein
MTTIVNIGLKHANGVHDLAFVRFVAFQNFVELLDPRIVQSDTEPTVVAVARSTYGASAGDMAADLHDLAEDLAQDCIAAWHVERREGLLLGPRPEAWGAFNPAFFIMPDGTRLA